MYSNINNLSWTELEVIIEEIATEINRDGLPEILIAVQRGGLIPAVMLSHRISVRELIALNVQTTQSDGINSTKVEPSIKENIDIKRIEGKNVLMIDDVVGSGATYKVIKEYLNKYNPSSVKYLTCAINISNWSLHNNCNPLEVFDFVGKIYSGWIVFPWEIKRDI